MLFVVIMQFYVVYGCYPFSIKSIDEEDYVSVLCFQTMPYMVVIHFPLRVSTKKITLQFCVFRQSRTKLLAHWRQNMNFTKNAPTALYHRRSGAPPSPCSMLFFSINLDRWRSISTTKKYSQHWIGGGGVHYCWFLMKNEKCAKSFVRDCLKDVSRYFST